MSLDVVYSYRHESTVDSDRADLRLATSGGPVTHPYFFDGFVERADVIAAALLVVARVARTRFYTPPAMVAAAIAAADPIVTSNRDRLRFESFSACCGVYCRLDALPDGLDRAPVDTGTTNVDFNQPMRAALAGIHGLDPMHLSVGDDEVRVTTMDTSVLERRVALPARWVRSLAEVPLVSASMTARAEFAPAQLRRFLLSQPRGAQRGVLYVVPAAQGPRLATRPGPDAVPVAGLERLRALEPILRYATSVRAHAAAGTDAGVPAAAGWQADLPGARLTLLLSPSPSRGFSGEGGLLFDLVRPVTRSAVDLVQAQLALDSTATPDRLAAQTGLAEKDIRHALTELTAAGRVGHDLADGAYFHRELPFRPEQAAEPARLRDARALVAAGSVSTQDGAIRVVSGESVHVVRATADGDRCSCTWFASHGLSRGPCKHILAARIHRDR